MENLELSDFLPAYSAINTEVNDPLYSFYQSSMPPGYTREFPISTFLKREFNSLKLPENDPTRITGEFKPLNNQLFISRFLSTYTPNNKLLVFQGVGSGKTCLFSLLSETIQDENPNMLPTLVLTRSEVLQANAKTEIANVCTNGKYIPDRWDPKQKKMITDETFMRRLNKNISQRYTFDTWERIAKELSTQDDKYIKEVYSNRVIVIDEAHGLRIQPRETTVNIYHQIFRLLHNVENFKIVLLTATPMRDRPEEIASLMNLLLSEEDGFDKDTFFEEYFQDGKFREDKRAEFKEKIRGLVSHVRSSSSNVKKIYEGVLVPTYLGKQGMRMTLLEVAEMGKTQNSAYESAYKLDKRQKGKESEEDVENEDEEEEGSAGLYKNSRQASLFVAPDGTYGTALEGKWLELSKEQQEQRALAKLRAGMSPEEREADRKRRAAAKRKAAKTEKTEKTDEKDEKKQKSRKPQRSLHEKLAHASKALQDKIFGGTTDPGNEIKLKNLKKMSSKYAGIIRQLLNNPTEKAFVYCNLVEGSGCNMFAAILQLFGFEHAPLPTSVASKPNMEDYKGKNKFILITSKFPTNQQASYLVNKIFNDPENKYGDYIRVIVASRIVSEGISFKATRQFHNASPGWNEAETAQAGGRVDRAFAHIGFPQSEKFIKTFRWCSMPSDKNFPSIDFEMYKRSEDKDFLIKQIERLLKESAVDCAFNVARNMRPMEDSNGSRNCDYSTCIYKCDGVPEGWYALGGPGPDRPLIDDTYNLYYARDQIDDIKTRLKIMFRTRFMYDLFELQPLFKDTPMLVLLRALKEMIDRSDPILNKYGIVSYLRENSNLYFLIDNHEITNTANMYLLSEYNSSPVLRDEISFHDYMKITEYSYIGEKLDRLVELAESEDTSELADKMILTLRSFDPKTQESILEAFIQASSQKINHNATLQRAILKAYDDLIARDDGTIISPLLEESYKTLRCYNEKKQEWSDCTTKQAEQFQMASTRKKARLRANPFGYYGVHNTKKDSFAIITVQDAPVATSTGRPDKRHDREGTVCGTGKWSTGKVILFLLEMGDIADKEGLEAPDMREYLSDDDRAIMGRQSNASNVFKLWYDKIYLKSGIIPNKINIQDAEEEKAELEAKQKRKKLGKTDEKKLKNLTDSIKEETDRVESMQKRIDSFTKDKLDRWYAILAFGRDAKKILCPLLEKWFKKLGYYKRR